MKDQDLIEDPKTFIESCFRIVDKYTQEVPFIFNSVQTAYYKNRTRADLILKARKEGITAVVSAVWLHACLVLNNTRAVIVSHTEDAAKHLFERVIFFIEHMEAMGQKIPVELGEKTMTHITFPSTNSSFWVGTAGSHAFGRGDDITHLLLSEIAHYQSQTMIDGVLEACVPNAYKVAETTANGVGDLFWRMWQDAADPHSRSPWTRHFYPWFADPTYRIEPPKGVNPQLEDKEIHMMKRLNLDLGQVLWYRAKRAGLADKTVMPQEYPSDENEAFLTSGQHVFDQEKLSSMAKACSDPLWIGEVDDDGASVNWVDNPEGNLRVWKMPREGRSYLISADVAEGLSGGDWSVAHVYDRSSWEMVAVWRGRSDPGEFGNTLSALGYFYNDSVVIPELNNHGWATVAKIKSNHYPHLLNTSLLWPENPDGSSSLHKDGFPTNDKTRSLIITAMRNFIDNQTGFIPDITTIRECQTFIRNETGKMEAQKGCFDDCVMASAIAIYCLKFMSLDETYRHDRQQESREMTVSSVIKERKKRVRVAA
jgi:hypothetical protein